MSRVLKICFFLLIVRPLVLIILGLNIRNLDKLPQRGPAVIAANHNSHLDTMVLMSLYPLSMIHKVRPVAAADYFLANRFLAWFSLKAIGIIPLDRSGSSKREEIFSTCHAALDNGDILIIFPEGTRGEPEQTARPKKGLFYLVKDRLDTEVIPVVMYGLGRALPRGEALLVPFVCDVVIGDPLTKHTDSSGFIEELSASFASLRRQCVTHTMVE
jgi:1-acyl-sn-glycerol-3-phosphate acyltransferase